MGHKMAKLTTKQRKKLKTSTFALPEERKYPINDRAHAANAKARATQQYEKGNLSKAEKDKIDAKADKMLGKKSTKRKPKRNQSKMSNVDNYINQY